MKKILSLVTLTAMLAGLLVIPAEAAVPYDTIDVNYHITASDNSSITTAPNSWRNLTNTGYKDRDTYMSTSTIQSWMIKTISTENGFEMNADDTTPSLSNAGLALTLNDRFKGQRLRADSVEFKIPDKVSGAEEAAYAAGYIRLFDSSSANTNGYLYGNAENGLKIINGGAYTQDMNKYTDKKWKNNFIEDGTLTSGVLYRAERILDLRDEDEIDPVTNTRSKKASNWQRFVIYKADDNTLIGDSGWVKTSESGVYTKDDGTKYTDPADFPFQGTGFGAWNYPAGTKFIFDNIKCYNLDEPVASAFISDDEHTLNKFVQWPTGATNSQSRTPFFGYSLKWHDDKVRNGLVPSSFTDIYYGMSFMLPELNTKNMTLIDFNKQALYPDNGETFAKHGSLKLSAGGIITALAYDASTSTYKDAVKAKDSENTFSVQLEAGKWYTAKHHISQADGAATAVTTITDSDGNVYETAPYSFRPFVKDTNELVQLVSVEMQNNTSFDGAKINMDNVKLVFASGEESSEGAVAVIDDNYENRAEGTDFYTEIAHENMWDGYTSHVLTLDNAMVVSDRRVTFTGVPSELKIKFADPMNKDAVEDGAVTLSQNGDEVTGARVSYDEETKTLTVAKQLSPSSTYTLTVDRSAATPQSTVLSALPTGDGSELTYTITTGTEVQQPIELMVEFMDGSEALSGDLTKDKTVSFTMMANNPNATINVPYVIVAAAYSSTGMLEDVSSVTGTSNAGDTYAMITSPDSITTKTDGGYIKVFVWDNWGTMKPVGNMTQYPSATATVSAE